MMIIMNGFIFIFGLIIGSFLNCVLYRLEKEETLQGRSYCPHCKHILYWADLVPVFSFLFLQGKCRYCRYKISWQYPLVEIATGLVFLLVFKFQLSPFEPSIFYFLFSIFSFYIVSSLIVIFVYDLKFFLIPDKILFPAILVAGIYNFDVGYFLAALIASGFFLALFLISQGRWMGFGDVKLAVLLGLLLGLPNILIGLFLAFLFGAIIGLSLMYFKIGRLGLKSEIPFGPFLITGTLIALFWGKEIIDFYISSFTF